jgi:hypothetical protein
MFCNHLDGGGYRVLLQGFKGFAQQNMIISAKLFQLGLLARIKGFIAPVERPSGNIAN